MSPLLETFGSASAFGWLPRTTEALSAYELISTTVLGSTASTVTFSGLDTSAAAYKHLQVRIVGKTSAGSSNDQLWFRLNGDTGSNYVGGHELRGGGFGSYSVTSALLASAFWSKSYIGYAPGSGTGISGTYGATILDLLDTSSSTKFKTSRALSGTLAEIRYVSLTSGLWKSTAPVTSVTLGNEGGGWLSGTRISIYGLKG